MFARAAVVGLLGAAAVPVITEAYGLRTRNPHWTYTGLWRHVYHRASKPTRWLMAGSLTAALGWTWHHLLRGERDGQ